MKISFPHRIFLFFLLFSNYTYSSDFEGSLVGHTVGITPLLAGCISQINKSEIRNGEVVEDNDMSISFAAGFIMKSWANTNIGFIVGIDHTGDDDWEHEGDVWISFSVGWKMQN